MLYDDKTKPFIFVRVKKEQIFRWDCMGRPWPNNSWIFFVKEKNAKSSNHSMYNTRKFAFSPAYLLVLVEWVDDQLHHAVDFSLERMFFRLFSEFLNLRRIQSIQLDRLLLSKDSQVQRKGTGDTGAQQITAVQQHSRFYWPGPVSQVKARQDFPISLWDVPQTFILIRLRVCCEHLCAQAWSCWPCRANLRFSRPPLGATRVHSGGIWLRQIFEVTPTAAPPHHPFWIHLCFCRGPPLRCHRRPPHPLL